MLENITKTSQKTNLTKDKSGVSETFIRQITYLQKVLGNREVQDLIKKGILNHDASLLPEETLQQGIIRDERKKEEYEEEQIKQDREALMEEIEQVLITKKDKARTLLDSAQGTFVYVNVKTHIVYADIPGETPSLFYHYTDLVDVTLSYQNINHKEQPLEVKRGIKIPFIFSFKYESGEEDIKNADQSEAEEKAEKEKAPGKLKDSSKVKKERVEKINGEDPAVTLFNTGKKAKKG